MKNFFKLFGIIAMVAVIGFSMAACGGDDGDGNGNGNGTVTGPKTVSGELTAGGLEAAAKSVTFTLVAHDNSWRPLNCDVTITTNLPAPNDSFTLSTSTDSGSEVSKPIECSTRGQKVTFTATTNDKGGLFLSNLQNNTEGYIVYREKDSDPK